MTASTPVLERQPVAGPVLDRRRRRAAGSESLDRLDASAGVESSRVDVGLGRGRAVTHGRREAATVPERPANGSRRSAPGKIRTCDLCLRRAALYPLSYGREGAVSLAAPSASARPADAQLGVVRHLGADVAERDARARRS